MGIWGYARATSLISGSGVDAKGVVGCGSPSTKDQPYEDGKTPGWWVESDFIFGPKPKSLTVI